MNDKEELLKAIFVDAGINYYHSYTPNWHGLDFFMIRQEFYNLSDLSKIFYCENSERKFNETIIKIIEKLEQRAMVEGIPCMRHGEISRQPSFGHEVIKSVVRCRFCKEPHRTKFEDSIPDQIILKSISDERTNVNALYYKLLEYCDSIYCYNLAEKMVPFNERSLVGIINNIPQVVVMPRYQARR